MNLKTIRKRFLAMPTVQFCDRNIMNKDQKITQGQGSAKDTVVSDKNKFLKTNHLTPWFPLTLIVKHRSSLIELMVLNTKVTFNFILAVTPLI